MNRSIPGFRWEAVQEAPVGGAGEAAPEVGAEPVLEPTPAAAPEAAAPDFGTILQSPEAREAVQRAVFEAMSAAPPEVWEPEAEPDYSTPFANLDPLDDGFGQQLFTGLAQMLEERDARLLQHVTGLPAYQAAEAQHHTAWAEDQFTRIEQGLGAPVAPELREMAITLAAGQRPMNDPYFDPGRALADSSRSLHELIQRERQAAVREYQEGLAGGGAGQTEPPATGTPAIRTEPVPTNMREAREAWERREGLR